MEMKSHEEFVVEQLQDEKFARAYLEEAMDEYLEDQDDEALLLALRHLAQAKGGIADLAKKAHLNRESLYKTLSKKGNPRLKTFGAIIKALGYKMSFVPDNEAAH
jgi:probable addiction module antidote protein